MSDEQVMTAEKIQDLRRRVISGQDFTKEELRQSVHTLMGERIAQAQAVATASRKRPSRSVNLDDLMPKADVNLDDLV